MRQWIYTVPLRLRSIFRSSEVERELDEELRFHLEARVQHEIAAGRTPEEARYAALRAMNGMEQRKEECRDMRRISVIDNLVRDIRYTVRTLARSPGFTVAALLALALGIGPNTAVFSVVNAVLLRPLSYADPDRLAMVFTSRPHSERGNASVAEFLDWRAASRSFETLDAVDRGRFTLTGDGEAVQISGLSVTATFFGTLKARPLLGRTFVNGEDQPGRDPTVVLSERLWRRRYASNPDIVGKAVILEGRPHTVIGVMPASFEFWQRDADVWAIFPLRPPTRRGPHLLRGLARLRPGVTVAQAAAEMEMIAHNVQHANPKDYANLRFPVVPLREVIVGDIRPLLWILSGAVVLVLLIAVSNVANLMLARSTARQREIALRLSIGAGRGRLVRQLMAESVLLSLAGGALGMGLAGSGVAALRRLGPQDLPRLSEIGVDGQVLAFTLLVSLASAVLFGLAPALAACAAPLNERLKAGGRAGESRSQGRARGVLVVAQVTLSVLLLIGTGLLIRSFTRLGNVDPGFQAPPDRVLTMLVSLAGPRFDKPAARIAFWDELLARIRALPGVEAASISLTIPPYGTEFDDYEIEGKPLPEGEEHPSVPVPFVSHDYRKTLGVPLLRGRWFDSRDRADTPRVTVISESMARKHFSGENPVGRRMKYGGPTQTWHPYMEIIGVVGDVKYLGLDRDSGAVFYELSLRMPLRDMWLLVRTQGETQPLAAAVRREIHGLDPNVPVDRVDTMARALAESVALPRFRSLLMAVFAATALLLAAIGIYGVIAYSVAQRTQEIGVRMALGATPGGVLRLVIGQGGRLAFVGIALGLAGAFGVTRVLEKMLFGVSASDTVTFASAALVLGAVAIVASLIPALRAARVDPLTALRHD
ncbi:MAG: ABC transporter permease [Bryobacteraceae bacterium]